MADVFLEETMKSSLLQAVSVCIQELSEIKNELRNVDSRVLALDGQLGKIDKVSREISSTSSTRSVNEAEESTHVASASVNLPDGADDDRQPQQRTAADGAAADTTKEGSLRDLCMIEDTRLKELFVAACEVGELRLELRALARRAAETDHERGWLSTALVDELNRGGLRAVTFGYEPSGDSSLADVSVARSPSSVVDSAIGDVLAKGECGGTAEGLAIVFVPVFRQGSWPLLEAAIRWCRRECIPSRLDVLHYAVRSLLHDQSTCNFRHADLFDLARLAPSTMRILPGGELDIDTDCFKAPQKPLTVDAATQAPLAAARPLFEQILGSFRASGGFSSSTAEGVDILELLVPLREPQFLQAMTLAAESWGPLNGQRLMQLLQEPRMSDPPTTEIVAGKAEGEADAKDAATLEQVEVAVPENSAAQSAAARPMPQPPGIASSVSHVARVQEAPGLPPPKAPGGLPLRQVSWNQGAESNDRTPFAETDCTDRYVDEVSSEEDMADEADESQTPVTRLRLAFVKCFREELFSQRPLLLSQLNNLYKMRSGEELNYKVAGYEKLRDFLAEIPGLSLLGRGNRMQVRVGDEEEFQTFQLDLQRLEKNIGQTPNFQMPRPLPEALLAKLHDLFLSVENYEIPLRNFLNVWNACYPTEQLAYRSLGFRDVRGVLSNVPFIEKLGGKSDAKYVLRHGDIPISNWNQTGGASTSSLPENGNGTAPAKQAKPKTQSAPAVNSKLAQPAAVPLPSGYLGSPGSSQQQLDALDYAAVPQAAAIAKIGVGRGSLGQESPSMSRPLGFFGGTSSAGGLPQSTGMAMPEYEQPGESRLADQLIANLQQVLDQRPGEAGLELDASGRLGEPRQIKLDDAEDRSRRDATARAHLSQWQRGAGGANALAQSPNNRAPGGSVRPGLLTSGTLGMEPSRSSQRGSRVLGLAVPHTVDEDSLALGTPRPDPAVPGHERDPNCVEGDFTEPGSVDDLLAQAAKAPLGDKIGGMVMNLRRKKVPKNNKSASFFVSSPAAISTNTRDASIHQGKFDMCSVLQTQLRQGTPCLVCDISGGQVMVTNSECEDLFESHEAEGHLVQRDVFSLIHGEDCDKFSNCLAYLMVSEKTMMEPQELRVVTLLGNTRFVRAEAVQLIGIWWQLSFITLDSNGAEEE